MGNRIEHSRGLSAFLLLMVHYRLVSEHLAVTFSASGMAVGSGKAFAWYSRNNALFQQYTPRTLR